MRQKDRTKQMTTKAHFYSITNYTIHQKFEFHILTVAVASFSFSKNTTSSATFNTLPIFTDCDWQTIQINSIVTG